MTPFQIKRREILFRLFDKFPKLSIRGTAIILFRDYPEFFNGFEHARSFVRTYRGKNGIKCRTTVKTNKYYK